MTEHPGGEPPTPNRITFALDHPAGGRGPLEGPDVDTACGAREPDVDTWEAGTASPTPEQVQLLAELTGYQVGWFYQEPLEPVTGWYCRPRKCEVITSDPDYRLGQDTAGQGALW